MNIITHRCKHKSIKCWNMKQLRCQEQVECNNTTIKHLMQYHWHTLTFIINICFIQWKYKWIIERPTEQNQHCWRECDDLKLPCTSRSLESKHNHLNTATGEKQQLCLMHISQFNINICSIELKWDGKITKIWYHNEMRWIWKTVWNGGDL